MDENCNHYKVQDEIINSFRNFNGNGYIIPPHIYLGILLLIHAGSSTILVKKGSQVYYYRMSRYYDSYWIQIGLYQETNLKITLQSSYVLYFASILKINLSC